MNIDVSLDNDVLAVEVDSSQWCRCYLNSGNERRLLGADDAGTLIHRLNRVFSDDHAPDGHMIDGVAVRWICTLSEGHYTLYASYPDLESVFLYWQAPDSSIVTRAPLTKARWNDFLQKLSLVPLVKHDG
jgi:hypothetical protein